MPNRIRELRLARGLSLTDLTRVTGIPTATLYRYEVGSIRQPSLGNARAIADALGADPYDVFPVDRSQEVPALRRGREVPA